MTSPNDSGCYGYGSIIWLGPYRLMPLSCELPLDGPRGGRTTHWSTIAGALPEVMW